MPDKQEKISRIQEYYLLLRRSLETAKNGNKFRKLLEEALNAGYPIDYNFKNSSPLLHLSLSFKKLPVTITRILLEAGADVNALDIFGRNALMAAVSNSNDPALIKKIANHTNDLDKIDTEISGLTAYGMLCQRFLYTGEPEVLSCIRYLLDLGTNTEVGGDYAACIRNLDPENLDPENLDIYTYQYRHLQRLEVYLAAYEKQKIECTTKESVYDYEL